MKKWILFVLILALGFLLRSGMFLHGDFIYLSDQARDLLLTKSFVVDHHISLIGGRTGFGGLFHGALWIYMISPFFFIFKGNPFLSLVPLFEIVNMGIIVVGFFAVLKLYGKIAAIVSALFLSISLPLISATPVTTNAEVLPIIVILFIFSQIKFIRGEDKYFSLSLLFVGLGFQFESAFAVLLIPLIFLAIVLRKKFPSIKSWIFGILGFGFGVSTFILFDLRHGFLMTKAAISLVTNTKKPLPGYEQYANIGFRVVDRIQNLWNSMFTPLYSRELLVPVLLVAFVLVAFFILIKRVYKKEITLFEKEYLFILFSPIIIFGIYIFYPFPLWPHYLLPISVFSVFILTLSLKILWQKPIALPFIAVFIILALIAPLKVAASYVNFSRYVPTGDSSYINQLNVANFVVNNSRGKDAGYFVYTPGILTYSMDFLLPYVAENNGFHLLKNKKAKDTYLILYPTLSGDNGAYAFWKKNVINTSSSPKSSVEFAGGITVESLDLSNDKEQVDPNYFQNLIFR